MDKFVLFDRDGTLIVDPEDLRVDKIEKLELFEDTIPALRLLKDAGFKAIIITNQAGISEGRLNNVDFARINNKFLTMARASGIDIIDTFMCPHQKSDGCSCIKPNPTMILEAAREHGFEVGDVFMVGDRETDILAGIAAGTKTILVETGNEAVKSSQANYRAATLTKAAEYIIEN